MKFKVYSRSGCPYCTKIKSILLLKNIEYESYELETDFNREEFYEMFGGGSTFPQVITEDGTYIGGCTEAVRYLKENEMI